jgi:hypothetical protein
MAINVAFEGWDEGKVEESIVRQAAQILADRLDEKAAELLEALVVERAGAKVDSIIDSVASMEFKKTNSYGEPTGETITLAGMLRDSIQRIEKDGYYNKPKARLSKVVEEELDKALRSELGKEIEAAKKEIRASIDAKFVGAIQEALKNAMRGL